MTFELTLIIVLLIINIPIYRFLFRFFFVDDDDYSETVRHTFTPNIISFFRGEYWKDRFNTVRLQFFMFICLGLVFLEVFLIYKIIDVFR